MVATASSHIGYTSQHGEKASRQHMGINGAWANPWSSYSWNPSVELGPQHSLVHGSHPSRTWVGVGRGDTVALGMRVPMERWGSPNLGHACIFFHPQGWAQGEAPAPLPTLHYCSCTDHQLLQTPARAAARTASMRGTSASVTPSACTTRAAAVTTPPSAKPKVLVLWAPSQLGQGLPGWLWVPNTTRGLGGVCAGSALHPPMSAG